eukprot:TRINITY_DN10017_c0_g1_i1.p1 TRINITY_DN10017_c0_g1~~TRINITY_DN10017_c0_g1_i1.p1  ORF type:complete len:154 (-),score=60.79 TRINITY_DN10017_c0_g1_i1:74-496(-)
MQRNIFTAALVLILVLFVSYAASKTSLTASIENFTELNMTNLVCHNSFGVFGQEPPEYIEAGSTGAFEANSNSSQSSTIGSCQYELGKSVGVVLLKWSIPVVGDNSYSINVPQGYVGSHSNAKGWQADVIFSLQAATSTI